MKTPKARFKIISFINPRTGSPSWRVTGTRRNGERIRENFARADDAQFRQTELEGEYHAANGVSTLRATRLTDEQVGIAEAAFKRLDQDTDLMTAVDHWLRTGKPATIKEIGGLNYRYNLRGDGLANPTIVDPAQQHKALAAVLQTLSPQTLTLPESILDILPPVPPGFPRTRESFASRTGLTFDPVTAAESAADLTLNVLLNPARAGRLIEYHMRVPASPALREVLEAVSKAVAERPEAGHTLSSEVARAVEFRALEAMLALAVNPAASSQARAISRFHIAGLLKQWTSDPPQQDTAEAIHRAALIDRLQEFERDPAKFVPAPPLEAPPGMPIGDDEDF